MNELKIRGWHKKILKKQLLKFLWDNSYGDFKNGNLEDAEDYEEYPEYLADKLVEFLDKIIK